MAVVYFVYQGFYEKADAPKNLCWVIPTAKKIRQNTGYHSPVHPIVQFFDRVMVDHFGWRWQLLSLCGDYILGVYFNPGDSVALAVNYSDSKGVIEAAWIRFPVRELRPEEFHLYPAEQYHGALI